MQRFSPNQIYQYYINSIDPRRLWVLYVLAVALIVALVGISHIAGHLVLQSAREDARIINLAGAQRMLSQRTLFLAGEYVRASDPELKADLNKTVDLFEARHRQLLSYAAGEPDVQALYLGKVDGQSLDEQVKSFIHDARQIANGDSRTQVGSYLRILSYGAGDLLTKLDTIVGQYEDVASKRIAWLLSIRTYSLYVAFVAVLVEVFLIFLPAQRAVTSTLERLVNEKKRTRKYKTQANHDPLTNLANRRKVLDTLNNIKQSGNEATILHIDLDGFKAVNDIHGHEAGDFILKYVSASLRSIVRGSDVVGRLGGDEFLVVCTDNTSTKRVERLCKRIIRSLSEPIQFDSHLVDIGASIGIAQIYNGVEPSQVISNADLALYTAKENGKGQFAFYDSAMRQNVVRAQTKSSLILNEVERPGAFFPVYQPYFNLETGTVAGLAALARWDHPDGETRDPSEFIDAAEMMHVAGRIDTVILKRAITDLRHFNADLLQIPEMSVNISRERLIDPEFRTGLTSLSRARGKIIIDIRESVFSNALDDELEETLSHIRAAGIQIAIDHFGEGKASLLTLMSVKPERIKLAPSVIQNLDKSESNWDIVQASLDISASIGAELVAEGIETANQREKFSRYGVRSMLGYHFARPMTADILSEKIKLGDLKVAAPQNEWSENVA